MVKRSSKNNKNLISIAFIVFAIAVTVILVSRQTTWFNFAKGPVNTPAFTNLNSAHEIVTTNNPDGTMGPATFQENAIEGIPTYLMGTLFFKVTDPPQSGKPTGLPTQAKAGKNGPQEITELLLTISKVEVHMAYQGDPKNKGLGKNKGIKVNKWLTLDLETPVTIDLVNIADSENPVLLAVSALPAGRYTQVRMYISGAQAGFANEDLVELEIPGKNDIVKVVKSFVLNPEGETTLTLDVDANNSVIKAGNKYILKPVVSKMIVE